MKEFGSKLRKARWISGLSISDVAHMSGVDRKSIINLEINGTNCRIDTLSKICRCTGISPNYLFGFSTDVFIEDNSSKNSNKLC